MSDNQQPTPPSAPPPRRKRKRSPSKASRWADAAGNALAVMQEIVNHLDDLDSACSELRAVQEKYEEMRDNMPDNLRSSAYGEKLEEVCNLEIEDAAQRIRDAVEEVESVLVDAEGADLPLGFGRD